LEWVVVCINSAGVITCIIGLMLTWRKNNHDLKEHERKLEEERIKRDTVLADSQANIISRLDDPDTGLAAINRKVNHFTENCARVSTSLLERIGVAERDIKEIKRR
jgi:hypothetical protein